MVDHPRKKKSNDLNLLARQIVEEATGEPLQEKPAKKPAKKNPPKSSNRKSTT